MRARGSAGVRSSTSISSWSWEPRLVRTSSAALQTLNRKLITSPSWMMYSLPSTTQLAKLTSLAESAGIDQVVIADDFSANEATLNVRVDLTGGLQGGGAFAEWSGPGIHLVRR